MLPSMKKIKLFMSGRSQALRLPKEFRFVGVREVSIRREGKAVILEPVEKFSWKNWWKSREAAGDGFLPEGRKQPAMQKRDVKF
jgi:antitoxin VapB